MIIYLNENTNVGGTRNKHRDNMSRGDGEEMWGGIVEVLWYIYIQRGRMKNGLTINKLGTY